MSEENIQNSNLYTLIMAGGQGTRFWPESTSKKPKQYLNLVGERSLLNDTLVRFNGLISKERRFIVTVKAQEQLAIDASKEETGAEAIIFEPSGRNTAPCILLSLATLLAKGATENDVVAIVPADHVILNSNGFREVIKEATELSISENKIVTIGINPNFPHTGYGYIHRGENLVNGFKVKGFKEKPDFDTAKSYLESGEYYWNAGMFVVSIGVMLEEFRKHSPEIFEYYEDLKNNFSDFKKISEIYANIPEESIDYAIMEKSDNVAVLPSRFDWNDLGSWDALENVIDKKDGNIIVKDKGHYFKNATDNIVFTPNQFTSLINVKDLIVVSNEFALVILPKTDSQEVKEIVESLKKNNPDLL